MPLKVALSGMIHRWKRRMKDQTEFSKLMDQYSVKKVYHIRTKWMWFIVRWSTRLAV